MKEKISITYSHQVNDDDTNESKIEYNKYSKMPDNIEKLLTYKKIVKNDLNGVKITNDETFNELYKKCGLILDCKVKSSAFSFISFCFASSKNAPFGASICAKIAKPSDA